jgi:hypothetical protein
MAKAESYNDLIFQLGDLARERLPDKPNCPRSMDRVFKAEDAVLARREELAQLEARMNDEDAAHRESLAAMEQEGEEQAAVVKQYKRAVDAIQGRVKELRKKIASGRVQLRYDKKAIALMDQKHRDLEMTTRDVAKIRQSHENLKRTKVAVMRKERELEDLQRDFDVVLTPEQGQPGAPGILAFKRILIMEDEAEERKAEFEATMADLDAAIAAKEQEVKASEEYLDRAVFMLGEDCYNQRLPEPELAVLYPRIDSAK